MPFHQSKRSLSIVFSIFAFAFLFTSCSDNHSKPEQTAPENPPGKMATKDGLNEINKTRDHTLYAKMQGGQVVGWEVQDNKGKPVDITFKKEEKPGSGAFKCLACIEKTNDDKTTETKCWEIPCATMPDIPATEEPKATQ